MFSTVSIPHDFKYQGFIHRIFENCIQFYQHGYVEKWKTRMPVIARLNRFEIGCQGKLSTYFIHAKKQFVLFYGGRISKNGQCDRENLQKQSL